MNSGREVTAVALLSLLVLGASFAAYYLVTTTTLTTQQQSISALQSSVVSLLSTNSQATATSTSSGGANRFPPVPWDGPILYMSNADTCNGAACFSSNFSQAYVFTCLKEAATPQGCTVRMNATKSISFIMVTVWYPYVNQTGGAPPWANCSFNSPGGSPSQFFAAFPSYCFQIGSNAFMYTRQPGTP